MEVTTKLEIKNLVLLFRHCQGEILQMKKEIAEIEKSIKHLKKKYYDKKPLEKEFLNKKVCVNVDFSVGYTYSGVITKIFDDGILLNNKFINGKYIVSIELLKKIKT